MRILVVDDDAIVRDFLCEVLSRDGIDSVCAATAAEAREVLREERGNLDVVLLDLNLAVSPRAPHDESGWAVLEGLQADGTALPVIILSGSEGVDERVRGLELGADDYIVKPVEGRELLARVRAVSRRYDGARRFGIQDLRVDVVRRTITRAGEEIHLSPREFDVLLALASAQGRPMSRPELLEEVWGIDFDPETNVVEVQIARLRRKLDRSAPTLIHTIPGQGYCLGTPAADSGV